MVVRRRRPTPSIRLVIALLTAIPVLTLGAITYESLETSDRHRAVAADLQAISDDIVTLLTLESELTIELYWAGAYTAISNLGLRGDIAELAIGFNVEDAWATASAAVDARLDQELAYPLATVGEVRSAIERGRAVATDGGRSSLEASLPYHDAIDLLAADVTDRFDEVDRAISRLGNDTDVLRAASDLALAAELRDDFAETASHYFALRFPEESTVDEAGWPLVNAYIRYEDATERFMMAAADGRRLHRELDRDPDVAAFLASAGGTVAAITTIDRTTAPSATDQLAEFAVFERSIRAIERHVELVDTTAVALHLTTQDVVDEANTERDITVLRAVLLVLAALLLMVIATRWIVRPLRSIAERAGRILEGDFGGSTGAVGLREIRDAEHALDEAASNIRLAEQQAIALADADLDAEVLSTPTRGRLDAALRSAFERLRLSIAEREEYRERLRHEAEHDPLTGLPNRPATLWRLQRTLAGASAAGRRVAVLFIDVDKFKRINDQQGHATGDSVLQAVARRLVAAVSPSDHVGRLAGDEFVVVVDDVESEERAIAIARTVRDAVSATLEVGSTRLAPTVSVGVSVSVGDIDADEMLRDADLAVYRAKTPASSGVEVCDAGLRDELVHRTDVERRVVAALEHDHLELHYQPIVDADTGRVTTYEALLRWLGPNGMLPDEFISIAERSDLIIQIDRWVIDTAVRQLAAWSRGSNADTAVAVNISARHVSTADLATTVADALERHAVAAERLVIEITESALLDDVDHAAHQLVQLRGRGIRVALDDFGTGHTSLSHLRELPVDILKLDREFVVATEQDRDRPLAKLIVDAGHLVGAVVVAEGVETEEQADLMRILGADELQGYLFGRPAPADDIVTLTPARAFVSASD